MTATLRSELVQSRLFLSLSGNPMYNHFLPPWYNQQRYQSIPSIFSFQNLVIGEKFQMDISFNLNRRSLVLVNLPLSNLKFSKQLPSEFPLWIITYISFRRNTSIKGTFNSILEKFHIHSDILSVSD